MTNSEFYRFAHETGYVTEAEKFGDSFCFINFLVGLKGQQADTDKFGKIFEKLDKDKTGYLSIDDIKAAVAEMQNDEEETLVSGEYVLTSFCQRMAEI